MTFTPNLYTTVEAANLLGIPEGTIRAWLSRYKEIFVQGKHIVEQEGKKLWTEEGLQLLKNRAAENATKNVASGDTSASNSVTRNVANNDALPPHIAVLESYLDATASSLAATFWQQLPARTLQHIQRMANSPLPQEKEALQQSLQQAMQLLPTAQEGKYPALPAVKDGSLQ